MVKIIVRLEGLAVFLLSLLAYNTWMGMSGKDAGWTFFILMFLVPDVSMIGYLKDKRLGSVIYNLVHNYVLPLILFSATFVPNVNSDLFLQLALILAAHIGIDRFLGFGLKYPKNFKETHIQKL